MSAPVEFAVWAPLPERVRVSLAGKYGLPPLGARISMRAQLMPVAGAVVPGGYDAVRLGHQVYP